MIQTWFKIFLVFNKKAVSDKISSDAIDCIVSILIGSSNKHIPAGFPLKGIFVKESTIKVLIFIFLICFLGIVYNVFDYG